MRKRIFLLIWLIGILFPIAWIGRFSSWFQGYFEVLFAREWVHIVMHIMLFAGLAILILFASDLPLTWKGLRWILLISLGVGVVQEYLQQVSGHIPDLRWNSLLDLGVDLGGAILGFGAAIIYQKMRRSHWPVT
jgi:hypothetical protein